MCSSDLEKAPGVPRAYQEALRRARDKAKREKDADNQALERLYFPKGAFSLREKRRGYPPGLLQEHKAHEGQAKGFPPLGRPRENGERGRRYVRYIVPGAHEEV